MHPSRVLLLDVDGVVLHQPKVLGRIAQRAGAFVLRSVPKVENIYQATELNKVLYSSFGHTHIGLRRLYRQTTPSLDEFNDFVYNDEIVECLWGHKNDPMLQVRGHQITKLLERAAQKNIPCYAFSNAPDRWCNEVMELLSIQQYIPPARRLSCEHSVFQDEMLKPYRKLYKNVATYIQQQHQDKSIEFVFVDDSFVNLVPVLYDPAWKPLFFSTNTSLPIKLHSDHITIVRTMDEVANLI